LKLDTCQTSVKLETKLVTNRVTRFGDFVPFGPLCDCTHFAQIGLHFRAKFSDFIKYLKRPKVSAYLATLIPLLGKLGEIYDNNLVTLATNE